MRGFKLGNEERRDLSGLCVLALFNLRFLVPTLLICGLKASEIFGKVAWVFGEG